MNIIDKLVWAIKTMLTRKLALNIAEDKKHEFERDIIDLLKKYKLYNNKFSALQRVEIVVDVDEIPKIDASYLILNERKK